MKFRRTNTDILEGDLTPMIDMTFQLIAFFMLIINFAETEKSAELDLPMSVLVKPPDTPPPYKMILNLEGTGLVKFGVLPPIQVNAIRPILLREIGNASRTGVPPDKISVIIRADKNVQSGIVQELMDQCKKENLETFALRVIERLR